MLESLYDAVEGYNTTRSKSEKENLENHDLKMQAEMFGIEVEGPSKSEIEASYRRYIYNLSRRLDLSWAAGLKHVHGAVNLIPREEVMFMLERAVHILKFEPNVLNIDMDRMEEENVKLTIVGDTHGQFYDVLNIFKKNGKPSPDNVYIFNGDFVDRGSFSFQVIFLLLCYKVLMPESIYLLRGNHETAEMNRSYGFFDEIIRKYDKNVMKSFWRAFDHLPLMAVVSNNGFRTLVVHGGIPDPSVSLEDLDAIERFNVFSPAGFHSSKKQRKLVLDILWSDPMKDDGRELNRVRGAGSMFGPDQTRAFLKANDLNLLVRSHQVKKDGYAMDHDGLCLTLFSCPNYCDSHRNKGAYLVFTNGDEKPKVKQFLAVAHPKLKTMAFSRL